MTSEQGYYSCQAGNLGSYNAAIFNLDNTIGEFIGVIQYYRLVIGFIIPHALTRIYYNLVVTAFTRNYYVKGIDPTNILLLCDLNNPYIPLKDVRMTTQQPATYNNPIVLNDLNQFDNFLLCAQGTSNQLLSSLSVIGYYLDA